VFVHVMDHTRVLGVFDATTSEGFDAGARWQVVHPDGWWSLISMNIEGMKS
jgi:hypothetical protein